ncbi:MFS transporter [Corynebacterium phocae]|uniref:MFS transporter n=1 Tax=Corynebacterium phocae TaxID=161895 RepID=A0A1L7D221_9CORY|nr:MFS transporter [Corynebacterium phocae]APT92195.1 MFS transporter [Corynebacterium phocae]KAA8725774.1 MFS transporter [Corynebacterium phocae]
MLKQDWFRVALGMYVVAFGANLFAPMILAYQRFTGLTALHTTFLFGFYAVGLTVALFIGGPLSDIYGRRTIIRPALLCTAAGSLLFLSGYSGNFTVLLTARLIVGVAVGLTMAAGAAWMKELSPSVAVGAQRSSVALTLGFATAPLIAGLLSQFLPLPTIAPYVVHLALTVLVIPLAWMAPASPPRALSRALPQDSSKPARRAWLPRCLATPKFIPVLAYAPWVFGSVTTAFGFLPLLVKDHTSFPIAVAGTLAFLTMGTGALVQRIARSWSAVVGLFAAAVGMGLAFVIAVNREHAWVLWLLPVAAVVLGFSYGVNMVNGLAETQALAPAAELGAATGVFYTLTYVGFFAPFLLSFVGPRMGYGATFAFGMVAAFLAMVLVTFSYRGNRG